MFNLLNDDFFQHLFASEISISLKPLIYLRTAELSDLIEERGGVVGHLVLTYDPIENALFRMVQLLQHPLAQLGLAILCRQWVVALSWGKTGRQQDSAML